MRLNARYFTGVAALLVAAACQDQPAPLTGPQAVDLTMDSRAQENESLDHARVHGTVESMETTRAAGRASGGAGTTTNLTFHGGTGGIGVETAPKVYLIVWGSQWNSNDTSVEVASRSRLGRGRSRQRWTRYAASLFAALSAATL